MRKKLKNSAGKRGPKKILSEAKIRQLLKMVGKKLIRDICEKFGISTATYYNTIKENQNNKTIK